LAREGALIRGDAQTNASLRGGCPLAGRRHTVTAACERFTTRTAAESGRCAATCRSQLASLCHQGWL